jgi:hypothetical protein
MTALDRLLPAPRQQEIDHVDLAAPPERVWEIVRHANLARSPFVRALFALRTLPSRLRGDAPEPIRLRIDDLVSSPDHPGFQVLADDPPQEVAVGAIGQVWKADIPFVDVADAAAFAAFSTPGYVKVAWAIRVLPRGEGGARVEIEVRVDATDADAWSRFRRYWRLIGPGSHFIRRALLSDLARDLGTPDSIEDTRPLPGDDLLPDAAGQISHGVTIAAPPAAVWPWLVQMGCGRAGYYSIDLLDNGNARSAREIHPELQRLAVGDRIPATPQGDGGFEVLRVDAPRLLVIGGLFDREANEQLPFGAPRPRRYWHVTWAYVLEPLDAASTRLHVRVRGAFPASERLHAAWIRPVHHLMESAQLRHLAARAEGRLPRDDARDVLEGIGGAARMLLAFAAPFDRDARSRWGVDEATAAAPLPGDALVPAPRWGWTHGIEIEAPASEVWPWIVQIGADRGGFYSYQWLENVIGCALRNAEAVHPELALREGDGLLLHRKATPLDVVTMVPGSHFVAFAGPAPADVAAGKPWVAASWLFLLQPLGDRRCRLVSRYRCDTSADLASRLAYGPMIVEPVGFAMDRRMLLGVKERAERR